MKQSIEPGSPPMLQLLFSPAVIAVETEAPGDVSALHPAEAAHVLRAVPKRATEFAAGRACAHQALRQLGITDFALLAAEDRRPLWPPGVVGSITHTQGYCAAVVAWQQRCLGLGIDTEQVDRVGRHLAGKVATDPELQWLSAAPPNRQPAAMALLFSAKEAFYKAQYPLTRQWLNFHDLRIEPDDLARPSGTFKVHALRELEIGAHVQWPFIGRYRFHDALVTTAVEFVNKDAG